MLNKLLLVIYGESFRNGPPSSRDRGGIGDYIKKQLLASNSHINLIKHIKNKFNIDTDIFINSYKLNDKDDKLLLDYYKNNLSNSKIFHILHDNLLGEQNIYNNTFDNLINNNLIHNYDHTLIIRMDIYLKKYFIDNISFEEKIKFAFFDSNTSKLHLNNPDTINISQHIIYIPKKFFHVIYEKIRIGVDGSSHKIRQELIRNNISRDDIKLYVNTLHICSTDLGWNPLFINICRYDNNNYNTELMQHKIIEYYYDDNNNIFIEDKSKTTDFYASQLETEKIDDLLTNFSVSNCDI